MIHTVYRRKRALTNVVNSEELFELGILSYDDVELSIRRYTPRGELKDTQDRDRCTWRTPEDFYVWLRAIPKIWSLDPRDAYFCPDTDLWLDEGL